MKLADALSSCAKLVPPDLYGTGIEALDLVDGGTGVALSDCYGDWNRNAPVATSDNYNHARQAVSRIALLKDVRAALWNDLLHENDPDLKKTLRAGFFDLNEEAEKAEQEFDAWMSTLSTEEQEEIKRLYNHGEYSHVEMGRSPALSPPSPPGDYPTPDPNDGTAAATPIRDSASLCEQVADFVGACNQNGWNSPECMKFMDRMKGCLDRTVADPADPAEPCSLPRVDPATVREVLLLQCEALRHPMPGENPCSDGVKGQAFEYVFRTGAGPGLDPCNDPYVRQTGEDCYPTFTLVEFGQRDIRDLMKEGLAKFGGPAFIIPIGPPEPDPGNPLPKKPGE
jgi:hypothetical protein